MESPQRRDNQKVVIPKSDPKASKVTPEMLDVREFRVTTGHPVKMLHFSHSQKLLPPFLLDVLCKLTEALEQKEVPKFRRKPGNPRNLFMQK